MHSNTNPTTLRARELRQAANPAERCLWRALKARQLGGHKFTRQFPVGPYFADFACREHLLLIEIDGSQHMESGYDKRRDAYLLNEGYSILRVPSVTVLRGREAVCDYGGFCRSSRLAVHAELCGAVKVMGSGLWRDEHVD